MEDSLFYRMSPFVRLLALFGIPAAGLAALGFDMEIPRSILGQADPLGAVGLLCSLLTVLTLLFLLRASLGLPSAPHGVYRDVLDFLAMSRWHPAVIVAFIALLVLPGAYYIHSDRVFLWMIHTLGWRVLRSGDFKDELDRLAVAYQLGLTAGVPLLFCMHMLSRWNPGRKAVLLWLFLPVLLVGTLFGALIVGILLH